MENVILSPIPLADLTGAISEIIKKELAIQNEAKPNSNEPELITRQEAANILGISLPTLNEWSKTGELPSYRIGSRVRYKRDEVLASVKQVQTSKYKRRP